MSPQLSFQFVNSAGGTIAPDVVYVTDDPTYNQIALELSLTSGSTTLAPGTIPDPSGPPPTAGTTLYFDLGTLQMPAAVWNRMTFAGTGWTFQKFASQGVVGMTPTQSLPLTSGSSGTISIAIGGVVVPMALANSQVLIYATYYNIPGVVGPYSTFSVALQNPPNGSKDLADAIRVSLSNNGIIASILPLLVAENHFELQLAGTQKVQVLAGPDTVFTVSFIYGAPKDRYGFGALTTADNGRLIQVTAGDNAAQWKITPNPDSQSPSWTLQPPDGAPIVGTGTQAIVAFELAQVLTTYRPGPTVMLVSYSGISGYQDGTFPLILNKIAHAQVQSLTVTPNPTVFSGGIAKVTVGWTTAGALGLSLTQNFQQQSVTGETSVPAVVDAENTSFTLIATGAPGTVANTDQLTVREIALPVVNSFSGGPTAIYSGSRSHDAVFSWAVDSPAGVTLDSSGNAFADQPGNATGSAHATITSPQLITLTPDTAVDPLTLTRRLLISAFTPTPTTYPLSFTPAAVVASPTGPFVALAGPGSSLTIADTVAYAVDVTVSIGHPATALVFSPDGTTLAAACSDGCVAILAVTDDGPGDMPAFGAPASVPLPATPQQLLFSPRGPRLFVTTDPGGGAPGSVTSLLWSKTGYRVEASVTVGVAPRGLCADAAGARLFVANSGDDTVSAIGLTSSGGLGTATTIPALTGGPTGIAATPSGQQLLVSCATAGTVVSIDPDHPTTGQRTTLATGGTPGAIAVTPDGAYAFVANANGTVALIDCWGPPSSAARLGAPIQAGAQPAGLTISPEGLQVLVAQQGGFALITLATHVAAGAPISTPNQPTSVEVTPDGASVFVWHDAALPSHSRVPGILVYAPASGQLSNLLADKSVLRCVASPAPLDHAAFATVLADPLLYVIDTAQLTAPGVAPGFAAGTQPIALAISGEGDVLFAVTTDGTQQLALAVLTRTASGGTWAVAQTLPLFSSTRWDRILLRATPDATTVFVVDVAGANVYAVRRSGSTYVRSPTVIPSDVSAIDLAVLPDGSAAYVLNTGTTTNTITVIDTATLTARVATVPLAPNLSLAGLQPAPDGRQLFATDPNAAALRVLDPRSLRLLQTISLASTGTVQGASGLAVTPDGSAIFTANTYSQNISTVEQIQMGLGPAMPDLARWLADGTPYQGLFMRHRIDDSPTTPTTGWSESPDVIANGQQIQKDLSIYTSPAGYADPFSANIATTVLNYLYVRGLNTTSAPITSRAYFYYTKGSLALWPGNWSTDGVVVNIVGGQPTNWLDISAAPNAVAVGQIPVQWTPPAFPIGTDHYCVIAWVDNGVNPQPPDFQKYSQFQTFDDLVQFVMSHHNMAWRNTFDSLGIPPDYAYRTGLSLKAGGGTVSIGITFKNIPADGTIAIQLQGSSSVNSINVPPTSVGSFQGGYYSGYLNFPALFETSVQVQHWPGATPVPPTAQITIDANVQTGPSLRRDIERMYRARGLRSPYRMVAGFPSVVLGSTTYNLKFGPATTPRELTR